MICLGWVFDGNLVCLFGLCLFGFRVCGWVLVLSTLVELVLCFPGRGVAFVCVRWFYLGSFEFGWMRVWFFDCLLCVTAIVL